jgi:hypothetical protein
MIPIGLVRIEHKKRARIKIQPRFKIQYPMKNRTKDREVFHLNLYPKSGISQMVRFIV